MIITIIIAITLPMIVIVLSGGTDACGGGIGVAAAAVTPIAVSAVEP